jgi:hypothetical protein
MAKVFSQQQDIKKIWLSLFDLHIANKCILYFRRDNDPPRKSIDLTISRIWSGIFDRKMYSFALLSKYTINFRLLPVTSLCMPNTTSLLKFTGTYFPTFGLCDVPVKALSTTLGKLELLLSILCT